jgi:hypothetical protein
VREEQAGDVVASDGGPTRSKNSFGDGRALSDECPIDVTRELRRRVVSGLSKAGDELGHTDPAGQASEPTWARERSREVIVDGLRGRLAGDLDAREQRHERRIVGVDHHSDRGSQYLSIRYTERLKQAGLEPSVGSVGDSYDNALAESIIGLYKTEVIRRRGPWRDLEAVEFATLEWVHWFNHRRLLEPIGHVPPAEAEAAYYERASESAMAA